MLGRRNIPVWIAAAALLTATCGVRAAGDDDEAARRIDQRLAASLKAAYLSKLPDFTTWPAGALGQADAPIVITVVGKDPHGVSTLLGEAIRKKQLRAHGHPLTVRRIASSPRRDADEEERAAFAGQLHTSHVIFVTEAEHERWAAMRELIGNRPILTVGEFDGYAANDGMIEFVIAQRGRDRGDVGIDMHINLDAVVAAKLKLNSRLLALRWVRIVRRSQQARDGQPGARGNTGEPGRRGAPDGRDNETTSVPADRRPAGEGVS